MLFRSIHTDFSSEGGFGAILYERKVRVAYVEIGGMKILKVYQADRNHPQSDLMQKDGVYAVYTQRLDKVIII